MTKKTKLILAASISILAVFAMGVSIFWSGNHIDANSVSIDETESSDATQISANADNEDVTYSYELFSDVMGMSGVLQKTESKLGSKTFCTRSYFAICGDKLREIAYATDLLQGEGEDYKVDINGDGINELICNMQSGDGHIYAAVFALRDNNIQWGYINLPDDILNAHDWWGHEAIDAIYNPNTYAFDITYYNQQGQIIDSCSYALEKAEFNLGTYDFKSYSLDDFKVSQIDKPLIYQQGPFNCVRSEMAFDDILGYSGYYLDRGIYLNGNWVSNWRERAYYAKNSVSDVIIAYSFGFDEDYTYDIDFDGETELLCNCENIDGTGRQLRIYKIINGEIFLGIFDVNKCQEAKENFGNEEYETYFDNRLKQMKVLFPNHLELTGKSWSGFSIGNECIVYEPWEIGEEDL